MELTCEAIPSGAFAGALTVASCRVSRATVDEDLFAGILLELREKLQEVIETGTRYVRGFNASLCTHELPQDTLRAHLGSISGMLDGLTCLIEQRDVLIAKHGREAVGPFWSDDLQDELAGLADEVEDLQETLALGLSAEFRQEVDEARQGADAANRSQSDHDPK